MSPDELEPMAPSMRALLDAERPLETVPKATRAKLYAKVSTSIAGLAAAGTAAGVGSAAAGGKAAAMGTSVATATTAKIVLVAAVAFSVGGTVGAGVHAVVAKPQPAPAPIVIKVEAPAHPERSDDEVVAESKGAPQPAPAPVKPTQPQPQKPNAGQLDAERSLIEQARTALSRNDAAAALTTLREHERTYPNGQLQEERMALTVLALSQSGDAENARTAAKKFRAKHPRSLLMPAVDNAAPP